MVAILELSEVSLSFGGLQAVRDLSLAVEERKITSLIGPNGAGKTTVFNLITGFLRPDAGVIRYKGRSLNGVSPTDRVALGISRSFQEVRAFRALTALENVLVAIPHNPGEQLTRALFAWRHVNRVQRQNRERAIQLLEFVGLANLAHKRGGDLSFGQQKRLALARLLATGAELLLLDEPAAGVDTSNIAHMYELFARLLAEGKTILLIEHNLDLVADLSHHLIVLHQGRKLAEGPPRDVMQDPQVLKAYLGQSTGPPWSARGGTEAWHDPLAAPEEVTP